MESAKQAMIYQGMSKQNYSGTVAYKHEGQFLFHQFLNQKKIIVINDQRTIFFFILSVHQSNEIPLRVFMSACPITSLMASLLDKTETLYCDKRRIVTHHAHLRVFVANKIMA